MKRKDGKYVRTFTFEGKRYYVYARKRSELDDLVAEKKALIQAEKQNRVNPRFEEFCEQWQQNRIGSVTENTLRNNCHFLAAVCKIVVPNTGVRFGDMRMKDITLEDMRLVQGVLAKDRSTRTVNDYFALLRHLFADARKERVIDENPTDLIRYLKRTEEEARDTYHRALTLEETACFFAAAKDDYYYNIFRIAIQTGMRIGEIGALKIRDIYADNIHIERTITRNTAGGYMVGKDAKTKAGKRTIPMNAEVRQIIEDQKKLNFILDGEPNDEDLIFKAPRRGILKSGNVDVSIKRICERIGIEPFTAHAFRDTFATRAIEQGMDLKTLQELLGHKDYSVTMNLYAHVMEGTKRKAMESLRIKT